MGRLCASVNFIPILGPLTGIGVLLLAGIVTLEWPWQALLPAACYTMIHIAEGEIITPMLLAKRFTLNPVLVIISLFFWYAVWESPDHPRGTVARDAQIVCDRIEPLKPVGHVMGA